MKILTGRVHVDSHQYEDNYVEFDVSDIQKTEILINNLTNIIRYMNDNFNSNRLISMCVRKSKINDNVSFNDMYCEK